MVKKRVTLDQVSGRLDVVTSRLDVVTTGLDRVTHGLAEVTSRVDLLTSTVDHLTSTVDHLAAMVANSFQSLQDEMRGGFRAVHARLDAHDGRFVEMEKRLDRIERKLDNTIERVNGHDIRLKRLEPGDSN